MKKATVGLIIAASLCLLVLGLPGQGAAQYLGQATWTISADHRESGPISPQTFTMTGAITHVGGAYYAMQGYVSPPDEGPFIISGSGVLIGDTIFMTLGTSQQHRDYNRDTGVMHVELNQTSLGGTFYEVGHDFDTSSAGANPVFDSRYTSGTVTLNPGQSIKLTQ
jgi:hypothetical protein